MTDQTEPQPMVEADVLPADDSPVIDAGRLVDMELPDEPEVAIEMLLEALANSQRDGDARLDDLQRLAAEFENYRKRAARDRDAIVERATQRLVKALLPVTDSFDYAFNHQPQAPSEEKLLAGIRGTHHLLMEVLAKEGLAPIPAASSPFDPSVHEAVAGGGSGDLVVAEELRRGYTLGGKVIRPALVRVEDEERGPNGNEG